MRYLLACGMSLAMCSGCSWGPTLRTSARVAEFNGPPNLTAPSARGGHVVVANDIKAPVPELLRFWEWKGDPLPEVVRAAPADKAVWKSRFQSTGQRAFKIANRGEGRFRVMIIGPADGRDTQAIAAMDAIAKSLRPTTSVLLLRSPNPDGVANRSHRNDAKGIVGMSFPSRFRSRNVEKAQLETYLVMRMLKDFDPHRVVFVRGGFGGLEISANNTGSRVLAKLPRTLRREESLIGREARKSTAIGYVCDTMNRECLVVESRNVADIAGVMPLLCRPVATLGVSVNGPIAEKPAGRR